jgi:hypothetical protein
MVWTYDTPTRFLVKSHSEPDTVHLVDLLAYCQNGECTCKGFVGHFGKIARGFQSTGDAGDETRCIHIRLARTFLLGMVLNQFEQQQTKETF